MSFHGKCACSLLFPAAGSASKRSVSGHSSERGAPTTPSEKLLRQLEEEEECDELEMNTLLNSMQKGIRLAALTSSGQKVPMDLEIDSDKEVSVFLLGGVSLRRRNADYCTHTER